MTMSSSIEDFCIGEKLYQVRARAALPILVRLAQAGTTVFYSDLAEELGMPNPRNLDYVLGAVGTALKALSKRWKRTIPPIQCLVINRATLIPGEGVGWFLMDQERFRKLNLQAKREVVRQHLHEVFGFSDWDEVLNALKLYPARVDVSEQISAAARAGFGEGEGPEHLALKEFVSTRPHLFALPAKCRIAIEKRLPSGDCLDVSFEDRRNWVSAEVKSRISCEEDITRGLFQCIKYQAIQEAVDRVQGMKRDVRAVLVLETALPAKLVPLRNLLSVEVIANVRQFE